MPNVFAHIDQLTVRYGNKTVLDGLTWSYAQGSHWVIGGKSGTGKSTLGKAIAGQHPSQGRIQITYADHDSLKPVTLYVPNWYQFTNLEGDRNFYYQQRYNRHQGQDTLTVRAELEHFGAKENRPFPAVLPLLDVLGFRQQLDSQLIELSSGEHKKLQLVKALWFRPQLLILDEPYTGLDTASRQALNTCLDALAAEGLHLIIISNDPDLPRAINRYAEIQNGQLAEVASPLAFSRDQSRTKKTLPDFLRARPNLDSEIVVRLRDVHVRYGDKKVLNGVSWEVKAGEKWVLQGPNGSGKSTLLSLINADHPQAYGHDITLFGNKRGSGESIW